MYNIKEPKCYCVSNYPANERTSTFPNGAPIERIALYRYSFYISLRFTNKQALDKTKYILHLTVQGKEDTPKGPPRRQLLLYHSQYIIQSFTAVEQLYVGLSNSQYRIYGVILCMCIDRGCVGTGENGGVE